MYDASHNARLRGWPRLPPKSLWRLFLRIGGWLPVLIFALSAGFTLARHAELIAAEWFDTDGRCTLAWVEDRTMRAARDGDSDSNGQPPTFFLPTRPGPANPSA